MTVEFNALLTKEWQSLHISHEHYEHYSLMIKLFSVALTLFSLAFYQVGLIIILLLAVLWLQEGIWKTYQARTCNRIELIEQALNKNSLVAFQFYSQFSEQRPSALRLMKEYITNSLKPTVIYPYAPLICIIIIASKFN